MVAGVVGDARVAPSMRAALKASAAAWPLAQTVRAAALALQIVLKLLANETAALVNFL